MMSEAEVCFSSLVGAEEAGTPEPGAQSESICPRVRFTRRCCGRLAVEIGWRKQSLG